MTHYSDVLAIPQPELSDVADVPAQLQAFAQLIDTTFGGPWQTFNPLVAQSAVFTSWLTIASTSVCKVKKIGKMVFVAARIDVQAGNGGAGVPVIYIPYPMSNLNAPLGVLVTNRGGGGNGITGANAWSVAKGDGTSSNYILAFDATTRGAGDWFGLFLRYETV